jgi:hypothetical protein
VNPLFQFYRESEFDLFHNINDEFCEMNGVPIYYLPKTNVALDFLYGEDPLQKFETKYEMTVYLTSNQNWGGQGDLYSKFGIVFTDEISVLIQKDRFITQTGMQQPLIGDLLYLPWQKEKAFFEITYCGKETPFYHLGNWSLWEIKGKQWVYSRESVPAIVENEEDIHLDDIKIAEDNFTDSTQMNEEDVIKDIVNTDENDPLR